MNEIISKSWIDDLEPDVKATILEVRANCMPQVDVLLQAGWSYELPEIVNRKEGDKPSTLDSEPWQWYWRSPAKRIGKKGRKYLSTNQAYNAFQKQSCAVALK